MTARLFNSIVSVCLLVGLLSAQAQVVGGFTQTSVKDKEVVAAAKFAIQEQSRQGKVKLLKIKKAERQVVAGMNYKLLLKVNCQGGKTNAEVVVWRKLSEDFALTSWTWK
jgi:hypothetical protein